jgi:hypothetical protein
MPLEEAIVDVGAVRFGPMVLTVAVSGETLEVFEEEIFEEKGVKVRVKDQDVIQELKAG